MIIAAPFREARPARLNPPLQEMREPRRLIEVSQGRNNNLNLFRLVAAALVLFSHSYPIATGDPHSEPWQQVVPLSPGALSVDIFFVISGFLVTASMAKSGNLLDYAAARIARIYPGLWVALLLTVAMIAMGAGGTFTNVSWRAFLVDPQTWLYFLKNATIVFGQEAHLPGVFADNPFAAAVNGSLWTLRYEVRLYIAIALLWLLARILTGRNRAAAVYGRAVLVVAVGLLVAATYSITIDPTLGGLPSVGLSSMFFLGGALHVLRSRLVLDGRMALAMLVVLLLAALHSHLAFAIAYRLSLPYLVLYFGFVPRATMPLATALPDCSYGIYIYAFVVQQMLVALLKPLSPTHLTLMALPLTILLAMLSWIVVEKPALENRTEFARLLRRTCAWSGRALGRTPSTPVKRP